MATIGEKIRELRKRQGMTQAVLSKRVGIAQASLCLLEKGKSKVPSGDNLIRLAEALDVEPRELLGHTQLRAALKLEKLRLVEAIRAIEQALSSAKVSVRPRIKAKLIVHLYESGLEITDREAFRLVEIFL